MSQLSHESHPQYSGTRIYNGWSATITVIDISNCTDYGIARTFCTYLHRTCTIPFMENIKPGISPYGQPTKATEKCGRDKSQTMKRLQRCPDFVSGAARSKCQSVHNSMFPLWTRCEKGKWLHGRLELLLDSVGGSLRPEVFIGNDRFCNCWAFDDNLGYHADIIIYCS